QSLGQLRFDPALFARAPAGLLSSKRRAASGIRGRITARAANGSRPAGNRTLGGAGTNTLGLGAGAAVVVEGAGFFHPAFVEVVADALALEADEVKAVDALVDFFPVEHPAAQLFDADAEQLFVIFLDLAPPRFVAWQILVFGLVVGAVVDVVVGAVLAGAAGNFLLRPWHFLFQSSPALGWRLAARSGLTS